MGQRREKKGKRSKKYCPKGAVIQIAGTFEIGLLKTKKYGIIHLVRTQNFLKSNISYPQIRTFTCAFQGV